MFSRPIPKFETATLYVCDQVIYLPTKIRYETEQAVDSEPIYVCGLDRDQITEAITKILRSQKVRLSQPESMVEIYKSASRVILNATKKRSWIQLAKDCRVYMVTWQQEATIISISQLDKKGRFEFPDSLQKNLPSNITLIELVDILLADIRARNSDKER